MKIDNKKIYDATWTDWVDMKIYGPASRWLRWLISFQVRYIKTRDPQLKTILDVGCGEGTITNMIAKAFPNAKVTGIDFSLKGIACAKNSYRRNNLKFIHDENSERLLKKYNLVCAFEVLEHVEDWQEFLGRMTVSSEKYLMLSFPTGRMRTFEKNVGHYRNFKKGEVEGFLKKYNFYPKQIFYAGFPFYNPIYRELCNLTDSGGNVFTRGKYGFIQKTVGWALFFSFSYFSSKKRFGDQFCGLFEKEEV